jgi:hypothetical protein
MAEAAVCNLPQIESTDVVFARRPLKPAEIETLGLRRGQVVQCSVSDDVKSSLCQTANYGLQNTADRGRLKWLGPVGIDHAACKMAPPSIADRNNIRWHHFCSWHETDVAVAGVDVCFVG